MKKLSRILLLSLITATTLVGCGSKSDNKTAENVKTTAKKEAEVIVREAQNRAARIVSDAEVARRKMNADVVKTEGDMNLYIEKLLANFNSALSLIQAAKAMPSPV